MVSDLSARLLERDITIPSWIHSERVSAVKSAIERITFTNSDLEVAAYALESRELVELPTLESLPEFEGIDGAEFSVVVIDGGVDPSHPFFGPDGNNDGTSDRIVYARDYQQNDWDVSSYTNSHGTNVASTVVGSFTANSNYPGLPSFRGVAPGANLIYLKTLDDSGNGNFGDVEEALQWVIENAEEYNIAAVNLSIGDFSNRASATTFAAAGVWQEFEALAEMDIVVVAAAGNYFRDFDSVQGVAYPAADPNVLAVGAVWDAVFTPVNGVAYDGPDDWGDPRDFTTAADRIASFSQRHETLLDITAPGAKLTAGGVNHGLSDYWGTSQASPFVAGAAVLAQQLATRYWGRRMTVAEFRDIVRETGATINDGDDENDNVTNTGLDFPRLDVAAMAARIVEMGPPKVKDVVVRNTGDVHGGYHVKDSDDTGARWAQIASAPVGGGMNQISITFTEDVTVDEADLVVTGGGGFGTVYGSTGFSYNSTNFTATWTFPTVMRDQLWLKLDATSIYGIRDADFNYLDGEWTNPTGYNDNNSDISTYPSGDGEGGGDFKFAITILTGDADRDGLVGLADLADLQSHLGTTTGAIWEDGDVTGDGAVSAADAAALAASWGVDFREWPTGGESLMGGGGGGEEMMGSGGEEIVGGGSEESLGGGGGESLLTTTPARIYITTSGSTAGGGVLPSSVPSVLLDGPEDSVTLYVWASMGDYEIMQTLALDVSATDEDVVKATASTIANPNIVATNFDDEVVDVRWPADWLTGGTLNPDGVGDEALVVGARAGAFYTTTNAIHAAWDGTAGFAGLLDEGYDATAEAFLLGSFTLEALAGSAGLSTDIVLSIGAFKIVVGESGVAHPIYVGLGETTVANNDVGATDGTAHATISVAAQGPSAVVMHVPSVASATAGSLGSIRPVVAASRPQSLRARSIDVAVETSPKHENRLSARRKTISLASRTITNDVDATYARIIVL